MQVIESSIDNFIEPNGLIITGYVISIWFCIDGFQLPSILSFFLKLDHFFLLSLFIKPHHLQFLNIILLFLSSLYLPAKESSSDIDDA